MKAAVIVEWLRDCLGENHWEQGGNCFWVEHEFGFGDTNVGFFPAHTIDYLALEKEMDAWIKETFPKEQP